MTQTQTLNRLAAKVRLEFVYGAKMPYGQQDEWQRNANGYRCTLIYQRRRYSFDYWQGIGITSDPTAAGCLESLLSDASADDDDFEAFCGEFGYDTDSRKAEKVHKACLAVRKAMQRLLGEDFEAFMAAER